MRLIWSHQTRKVVGVRRQMFDEEQNNKTSTAVRSTQFVENFSRLKIISLVNVVAVVMTAN